MNLKSSLKNPIFKTISEIADELNYPTYVIGGWVRDLLINRKQTKIIKVKNLGNFGYIVI